MAAGSPIEFRLELYSDAFMDAVVAERISTLLKTKWPVTWDVKVPATPSLDHPARWHAVILPPGDDTPEKLHRKLCAELNALDGAAAFHYRTRWDFPQSPNEQEIYEERWKPARR